jgi:hypothetical protein
MLVTFVSCIVFVNMSGCSSNIWEHFKVCGTDTAKAICNHCASSIARGGTSAKSFGTINLREHLRVKHCDVALQEL